MSFKMPNKAYLLPVVCGGVVLLTSFQNCSPGGFSSLTASEEASLDSTLSPGKSSFVDVQRVSGYIFSGSYRANSQDASGIQVCEYPSGTNCTTDADGKSKGRMQVHESGLSTSARLHKLSFDFISDGYFAKNREAHFAIGLRGNVTQDEKGDPVAINGRGFIIGQLGGDSRNLGNPACSRDMAQIETYHGDAGRANPHLPWNHIYPESCSDVIFQDDQWYRLELYVSTDRKIGYKVFDDQGILVHSHLMQDPTDYINANLSDWFMGHVFDTAVSSPSGNWSITVRNLVLSQSDDEIENSFKESLLEFSHLGRVIPENSVVLLSEMANDSLLVGDFTPLRPRIFGCAGPDSAVQAGACSEASEFRVIELDNDGAFRKIGNKVSVMDSPIYQFPNNLYKLTLRLNPQSSYKQVTVRVLKE